MLEYQTPFSKLHMRYSYNTHAHYINDYHPIHVTGLVSSAIDYSSDYGSDGLHFWCQALLCESRGSLIFL
jgi:hypothetical protein